MQQRNYGEVEDFISGMCPDCKGARIVKICQDIAKIKCYIFGTRVLTRL